MWSDYRAVFAVPAVRRAVLLGFVVRMPMFTSGLIVTIHLVTTLHRSYAEAGVASTVLLAGIAIGGPWRGRLLDRYGLRRVVAPTIAVQGLTALTAPFVGYLPLLPVLALSGLFITPGHAVIRQSLITGVPDNQRRMALSLDGVLLELSAAICPAIAVAVATVWSTRWVLFVTLLLNVVAGALLWWFDLPIHAEEKPTTAISRREWFGRRFVAILVVCTVSTMILSATDLGIVAMLREFQRDSLIGLAFASWCIGSLVGGVVYGALRRQIGLPLLLAGLSTTSLLPGFATGATSLLGAVFVAGLLCQPVITAGVEALSQAVPDRARGEALGFHATAMTAGSALGAPFAGLVIDGHGGAWAFLAAGATGLLVALAGMALIRTRRSGARPVE